MLQNLWRSEHKSGADRIVTNERPQSESEDTENLCLEVMASTITKLDKIGVKLHIIEVAKSEFCITF